MWLSVKQHKIKVCLPVSFIWVLCSLKIDALKIHCCIRNNVIAVHLHVAHWLNIIVFFFCHTTNHLILTINSNNFLKIYLHKSVLSPDMTILLGVWLNPCIRSCERYYTGNVSAFEPVTGTVTKLRFCLTREEIYVIYFINGLQVVIRNHNYIRICETKIKFYRHVIFSFFNLVLSAVCQYEMSRCPFA
jgi:hypothetical protein